MRIKVINPNTSAEMTASISEVAAQAVAPGTTVVTVYPDEGPESIESYFDEYLAIPGVLTIIHQDVKLPASEQFDGYVLACWGDPGADAAREIVPQPVVGIAEASMYAANAIAPKWSVVTTLRRSRFMVEEIIRKTGLENRCSSVRCADVPVLACEENPDAVVDGLEREGRLAVVEDGAEAIILGCAGMGGLAAELSDRLGVPCVDPVAAGVKFVEMLVGMGLSSSKTLTYQPPEKKTIHGYSQFSS